MNRKLLPLVLALPALLSADVTLPPLFADHAVLARSERTPVFGKADPQEAITVTFAGQTATATAGQDGKWRVNLDLAKVGEGPFELAIKGKNALTLKDILVGEVWLCSGQSNMGFQLNSEERAKELIAESANPKIRLFKMGLYASVTPSERINAKWEVVSPSNVGRFTAVGYLFGKAIQKDLQCPVGLIDNAWGGSGCEAWVPVDKLQEDPELAKWSNNSYKTYVDYPTNCANYIKAYKEWLKAVGIAEPTNEMPAADAQWKDKQRINYNNRTGAGITWYKKTLNVPQKVEDNGTYMDFHQYGALVTVYIDGKEVARNTYEKAVRGDAFGKRFNKGELKAGEHEIIIRVWNTLDSFRTARLYYPWENNSWETGWQTTFVPQKTLTPEQLAAQPQRPGFISDSNKVPALLYNALIFPLKPYRISGSVWYQGCTNSGRPLQYPACIQAMIRQWRADFESEFPFYYCSLANYTAKVADPNNAGWAAIRVGQQGALAMPKTGEACLIDCGEASDIHPLDKVTVGNRLAALALRYTYGRDIPANGPVCKDKKVEGNTIRLSFDFVNGGLVAKELPATYWLEKKKNRTAPLVRNSPDSQLEGFAIAGQDGKYVWANARIDGDTIVVWSDKVPAPVSVRYAFQSNPTCNLYNKAGFPAVPFQK